MAALSVFLPRVLIGAPGCAEFSAEQAVLDACIQFCRETLAMQQFLSAVTVTPGTADYALNAGAGLVAVKVMEASLDGYTLEPAALADLARVADWNVETGPVECYTQLGDGAMKLYRVPDAAGSLRIRAAVAPTRAATAVPDMLADRWLDAVTSGALSRLLMQPDRPYTNPKLAQVHLQNFFAEIAKVRVEATKGFTNAPLRVRSHAF